MFFFFNDTATTEIYTLSLHDALPILVAQQGGGRDGWLLLDRLLRGPLPSHGPRQGRHPAAHAQAHRSVQRQDRSHGGCPDRDRKSTRLNSSHANISYAVFCLKKKKKQ